MRIWSLIFCSIVLCAFTACKGDSLDASEKFAVQQVTITPKDSRHYENLPPDLTQALNALEFTVDPSKLREIGGIPEAKIKLYTVKGYVEYADGWIVASGYGEWGGVVFWIDKNGGYEIIRDDDLAYPIDIVADANTIFIAQGMNHLILSQGHLLVVNRSDGAFDTAIHPVSFYPRKLEIRDDELVMSVGSNDQYFVVSELRSGKTVLHDGK